MSTTTEQKRSFSFPTTEIVDGIKSFGQKVQAIDKVKVVLYVTWLWAWAGLYVTKVFECIFRTILAMPDSWLSVPANMCKTVKTTQQKRIQILNAATESGEVTNKLKLFLRYYWEQGGGDAAFDANGFSMNKLSEFLNCSLLFCSYIISSNGQAIEPATFLANVKRVLIEKEDEAVYMSTATDRSDRSNIFLGHISLDDEVVAREEFSLAELLSSDVDSDVYVDDSKSVNVDSDVYVDDSKSVNVDSDVDDSKSVNVDSDVDVDENTDTDSVDSNMLDTDTDSVDSNMLGVNVDVDTDSVDSNTNVDAPRPLPGVNGDLGRGLGAYLDEPTVD